MSNDETTTATPADWKAWPKVSPARSGAANTKRYDRLRIAGRNGGEGELMGMGTHFLRYGPHQSVAECAEALTADRRPSRAGISRTSTTGVAHVGFEVTAQGLSRAYQRFVLGEKTGTPRFYGERWS